VSDVSIACSILDRYKAHNLVVKKRRKYNGKDIWKQSINIGNQSEKPKKNIVNWPTASTK